MLLVDGIDLRGATVFRSALSRPLVLDELVPGLAAVDGDPTTEVPR